MLTASQLVKKKMRDITLTDENIFTSSAMAYYLRNMIAFQFKKINRKPVPIRLIWEEKGAASAFTDNASITINPGHPFVKSIPTREKKLLALFGLLLHEFGHNRFSDFLTIGAAVNKLESGVFYPNLSDDEEADIVLNEMDFQNYLREHQDKKRIVTKEWHHLQNIFEDGYIEECLYRSCGGDLIDGLNYIRLRQVTTALTAKQMLAEYDGSMAEAVPIIHSMLLLFSKFGRLTCDFSDEEEMSSIPVSAVVKCVPLVRGFRTESNSKTRTLMTHRVFLRLWPILKEFIDVQKDEDSFDKAASSMSGDMGSSIRAVRSIRITDALGLDGAVPVKASEETGHSGSASASKKAEKEAEDYEKSKKDSTAAPEDEHKETADGTESEEKGEKPPKEDDATGKAPPDPPAEDSGEDSDESVPSSGPMDDEDMCSEADEGFYSEEEVDELASLESMERVIRNMDRDIREEIATDEVMEEMGEKLDDELSSTNFGYAHKNMRTVMNHIPHVSPETKEAFNTTYRPILAIAHTMAKKCKAVLQKKENMEKAPLTGFYSGARFDATRLVMNDMRYFKQNALPTPDTRLAVSLLIDESGSMCGARIDSAQAAAIALYTFCIECGINVSVIGHTADLSTSKEFSTSLDLTSYADFDSIDVNDKYRLCSISAKNQNRDGAALLFAGEHLLKRNEPIKLMFVISDGCPCASGYYGPSADKDTTLIAQGLKSKGIKLFALGIGGDKKAIEKIYGSGFIDITNLNELPQQMLMILKRFVR